MRSSLLSMLVAVLAFASTASAATISVPAGGDLQAAINAARPGDTILLAPGATYTGSFVLPVHGGTSYITIRTNVDPALVPGAGVRMTPAYAPYLAKVRSGSTMAAMRTAAGAAFWRLQLLEFLPNAKSMNDILALGDGSSAQNTLARMPHHLIVDRIYLHGDPLTGQKRGIALNSGETTIVNSHVSDIKGSGQDTQAIAGWNGTGPYYIANNYLEAAGNGVLIGGDDPKIADVTASDIIFRGNTITRPLSWRDPIVATPANLRAGSGTGGSLPAGTYGYRVTARRDLLTSKATSTVSNEVTVTVAAGGQVSLAWDAVPGATDYLVYGRTAGTQGSYWTVTGTSFTDTGASAGTAGTPAKASYWTVKNLFELKNARRVQVDYNLMENNWAQAQNGFAILFTPRNQYGGCTWCVVEDVTFEYNVVRHMGGGINLTGWDNVNPSQQTRNVVIRHNEFADYSKTWGGTGYFLSVSNEPRDITVDHNTLISGTGAGQVIASGLPMYGFVFTNNVGRHDSYGIYGSGKGGGNAAIAYYFPDGVITRNVLAGATGSYPSGNLFPSLASFIAHFVDATAGNYALVPGTDWAGAGTDGLDLGANMSGIYGASTRSTAVEPPSVTTASLPAGTESQYYLAMLEAVGGRNPYRWSIVGGALPAGLTLDPQTGELRGAPLTAGGSAFTVEVTDGSGATARAPLALHVEPYIPPNIAPSVSITASAGPTVPLASPVILSAAPLDSDGFIVRVDLVVDGEVLASDAVAPFDFTWQATAGEHQLAVVAVDDRGATATSAAVSLTANAEVVLYATDATALVGAYQLTPYATAAEGVAIWNPNAYAPKATGASAAPVSYVEFQFYAEAGRAYHVWIRGRAQNNVFGNDSAYLQFSGVASARIATTTAMTYQLEDAPTAGLSEWGWQDNGLGTAPGMMGAHLTFETSGLQTLRIQPREDGLQFDQIVISPDRYLLAAPGGLKNDATIVGR